MYFDHFKVFSFNLKFSHIKDGFQVWAQLVKWSLSSLIPSSIWKVPEIKYFTANWTLDLIPWSVDLLIVELTQIFDFHHDVP